MEELKLQQTKQALAGLPLTDGRVQRKISEIGKKIGVVLSSDLPNEVKSEVVNWLWESQYRMLEGVRR